MLTNNFRTYKDTVTFNVMIIFSNKTVFVIIVKNTIALIVKIRNYTYFRSKIRLVA